MTETTPAPASPEEEAVGIAVVLGREIKMKRMSPDQLLAADMMARRLQRLASTSPHVDPNDPKTTAEWEKFIGGTRRLLDWVSGQFHSDDDLEWFEDRLLSQELELKDIGPLLTAMGMPADDAPKATNRRARRAK